MKVQGSYIFQASSERVFQALLDPAILRASIPGCESAWYSAEHGHMKVRLVTPVPGLEGPYDVTVNVLESQSPHLLVVQAGRNGRIGGSVMTVTRLTLQDATDGTHLNYETTIDLKGPIAVASNPLFQGMAKHSLKTFLKRLNARLVLETEAKQK